MSPLVNGNPTAAELDRLVFIEEAVLGYLAEGLDGWAIRALVLRDLRARAERKSREWVEGLGTQVEGKDSLAAALRDYPRGRS